MSPKLKNGLIPTGFVLLWSTGFIGARLAMPHAEPLTFLALRFMAVLALLVPLALVLRHSWPGLKLSFHAGIAGFLVHALYLGGVFIAIDLGLSAGLTALIVGLQPLLTAVLLGPVLGQGLTGKQWAGIGCGLVGVSLVLAEKINVDTGFSLPALSWAVLALLGITLGTLYQQKFCRQMVLTTGACVQFGVCGLITGIAALRVETQTIEFTPGFWIAFIWLVVVLSIGAIFLLLLLIRKGEAAKTASLFYLIPPMTALEAWVLFDERFSLLALSGMGIVVFGVALVVMKH